MTRRSVDRRSALVRLGVSLSAGALGMITGGCTTADYDYDPYDGPGGGGGTGYGGSGGTGSGGSGRSDYKSGDGSDYTVYADNRDLDGDSRDNSDHFNTRTSDRSGYDYD